MSLADVAHFLFNLGSACLSMGLIGLGIGCLALPDASAEMYGLPTQEGAPWVMVAGLRDLGLGVAAVALFLLEPRAMRVFVPTLLIIVRADSAELTLPALRPADARLPAFAQPIGDALLTLKMGGTVVGALTHTGGVVCIGVLAVCAWLDPALSPRAKAE